MPKLKNPSVSVTFRMKASARKIMKTAAEDAGFCEAEYLRLAVSEKMHRDKTQDALIKSIQNLSASLNGIKARSQMNLAATTTLARLLIICLREPTGEALQAAVAAAPARETAYRRSLIEEYNAGGVLPAALETERERLQRTDASVERLDYAGEF